MYKTPPVSPKDLEEYFNTYSSILSDKIEKILKPTKVIVKSKRPKLEIKCQLIKDSEAYNWVKSLKSEENLKKLLIGDFEEMKELITKARTIQPDIDIPITKQTKALSVARSGKPLENLNAIFYHFFVEEIYDKELNKDRVMELKKYSICPYCGAVKIRHYDGNEDKKIKRFQLDHYFPKSKFPYLAINLNNLIPVCKDCNMVDTGKGDKMPLSDDLSKQYLIYPEHFKKDSFYFQCDLLGSEIFNPSNFEIDIDYKGHDNIKKGYNEIIEIENLYKNEQNCVKDIFSKMESKNESYKELTSLALGIDISKYEPNLKNILFIEDTDVSASQNEMHKFKVDIFNFLKNFLP